MIPGQWLKECVDEWHQQFPGQLVSAANAAAIAGGAAVSLM